MGEVIVSDAPDDANRGHRYGRKERVTPRPGPRVRRGTLSVSWGPSGGFYLHRRRLCLGRVAVTYCPDVEIDDLMEAYADQAVRFPSSAEARAHRLACMAGDDEGFEAALRPRTRT